MATEEHRLRFEFRETDTTTVRLWSLSQDALVEADLEAESLVVVTRWGEFDLSQVGPVVYESLRRMRLGPVSLHNAAAAADLAAPGGGVDPTQLAELEKVLAQLGGSIVHSLGLNDGQAPLLSVHPVADTPEFRPVTIAAAAPVRLSRFASLRPNEGGFLLEAPVSRFAVTLSHPAAVQVVTALAAPTSVEEIMARSDGKGTVIADIVAFLVAAGVVLVGTDDLRFVEDTDPALRAWSHHELSFQRKSRTRQNGMHPEVHLLEKSNVPAPIVKPAPRGRLIPLFRPLLAPTARNGDSLTNLMETDHVCPTFSTTGLTGEMVGELLYRAARIRSTEPGHLPLGRPFEVSQRPYFNIACLYELELYLCVNRCSNLERGIYHYSPQDHALTLVNGNDDDLSEMLDMAKFAAASSLQPSALISVTARMERTSWALGAAAYSTALMHLGALQQTLYLTAKSMSLSAHAVPVDDSATVDRALGLDWPAEVGIGECVLDRLP